MGNNLNENFIELKNIDKSFGKGEARNQVLFDVNLRLPTGELSLLVGPSGCGKTTLISIIAGILNPDNGGINLFGSHLDKFSDEEKTNFRKDNVGFIFQQFNLIPTLSILENVSIPLLINHWRQEDALEKSREVIKLVGLDKKVDFTPNQLSGGQQQRVAIARALVREPKLLICDEPTASLDGTTGQHIMETLKALSVKEDRCVIIVTHDSRIFHYGDRMVTMEDGRIISNESVKIRI